MFVACLANVKSQNFSKQMLLYSITFVGIPIRLFTYLKTFSWVLICIDSKIDTHWHIFYYLHTVTASWIKRIRLLSHILSIKDDAFSKLFSKWTLFRNSRIVMYLCWYTWQCKYVPPAFVIYHSTARAIVTCNGSLTRPCKLALLSVRSL